MTIDEHLAAIEAMANAEQRRRGRTMHLDHDVVAFEEYSACYQLSRDVPKLVAALRRAVNTLKTMGMTETLAAIERALAENH